jgi:uncharacterized damage-inducible protein DinB
MSQLSTAPARLDEDPRYPLGRFVRPSPITEIDRSYAVACLAELPTHLRNAVQDLDDEQLSTPYRPGGWTVRQLVHHIADSHTNAVLRVRKALTEDWPTIATYDEKAWAQMPDYAGPVEWSLELIEALHARWVLLLQSLSDDQWRCGFVHPKQGSYTVEDATMLYAWHSRHHVAHITHLSAREKW